MQLYPKKPPKPRNKPTLDNKKTLMKETEDDIKKWEDILC